MCILPFLRPGHPGTSRPRAACASQLSSFPRCIYLFIPKEKVSFPSLPGQLAPGSTLLAGLHMQSPGASGATESQAWEWGLVSCPPSRRPTSVSGFPGRPHGSRLFQLYPALRAPQTRLRRAEDPSAEPGGPELSGPKTPPPAAPAWPADPGLGAVQSEPAVLSTGSACCWCQAGPADGCAGANLISGSSCLPGAAWALPLGRPRFPHIPQS